MISYKKTLWVYFLLVCSATAAMAQSPYTRYGLGAMTDQGSGNSRAMGGLAYGLRDKYQTNTVNPASYTAVDSLTFIFDGGMTLQNTNFSNGKLKKNSKDATFDYITMQFRAARWAAISAGILPYSTVNYGMGNVVVNNENSSASSALNYSGTGGLHRLYAGVGFKILKNLSVGANISYLWGDITQSKSVSFPYDTSVMPVSNEFNISVSSYKLDFGAQYTQQFGKKHQATFGVVFSPGHDLKNEAYNLRTTGNSTTGTTAYNNPFTHTGGIANTFGAGVAYTYNNRLTVGADVTYQDWSKVDFMNEEQQNVEMSDSWKVSLGAEIIPNPMGRSYLANIKYRLGAFCSKPYYKINGKEASDEYGVTFGFGLPIPRTRSVISLSGQYVRTNAKDASFLDENTLRVCVGITFNERWFFKRKVN